MGILSKKKHEDANLQHGLKRVLTTVDLVFLGVGAIIGAGIFVLTGIAAATKAGPAIVLSYVIAGLACAFSALAYAELAASVGGCGSAYNYAYVGMGEIFAWIIGWDLLLEYAISVSAVSAGWSGYVSDVLASMQIKIPYFLLHGPLDGGYFNLPAVMIILVLSTLLIIGVKGSARVNNLMVIIKLSVIAIFVALASFNVKAENWMPFMPFGWSGVMQGAALIFFAYIGFDAVSTAAEETINPQRDLPKGIIYSLAICTVIYMIVAGLLTAIVHYQQLNVSSPISYALLKIGHRFAAGIIGVGAIAGLTTVMLVLYYGLTRVFLSMSRDRLLPEYFSKVNPITFTPVRIIVFCGIIIALFSALVPLSDLAELVNIGTLAAFLTVCIGVIAIRRAHPEFPRPFKTPLMPYVPILGIITCLYLILNLPMITILRFAVWMVAGAGIYFMYSRHKSRLTHE